MKAEADKDGKDSDLPVAKGTEQDREKVVANSEKIESSSSATDDQKEKGTADDAGKDSNEATTIEAKNGWTAPLPRIPMTGAIDSASGLPDHDLLITIRILPQLLRYAGSLRSGLVSRGWGAGHDGNSIRVIACEKVPCGAAVEAARRSVRKLDPVPGGSADDFDGYLLVLEPRPDKSGKGVHAAAALYVGFARQNRWNRESEAHVKFFTRFFFRNRCLSYSMRSISYSPATLNFWPPFLLRVMYQQVDNQNPPSAPSKASQAERMRKWEEEWKDLIAGWEGVRLSEMWYRDWRCWRVRICGKGQTCLMETPILASHDEEP